MSDSILNTSKAMKRLGLDNNALSMIDFKMINERYYDSLIVFEDTLYVKKTELIDDAFNFLCLPHLLTVSDDDVIAHTSTEESWDIKFL